MSTPVTRRDFFGFFTAPLRRVREAAEPSAGDAAKASSSPTVPRVAVIQGRYCLAYHSICSVCVERCPVPGAISVERGIPMVVPAVCPGCGVCHEVCPARRHAILQVPRRLLPARPTALESRES